ncbi:MAG: hypothetical protein PUF32_04335 [Prevotella sp.]|nr:hypothetical protein [Prevotella sp.]
MEKKLASFKEYEIFMADESSLNEIASFVVRENYAHHTNSCSEATTVASVAEILEMERYLYDDKSRIFIARTLQGKMIGCIRSFHWDKIKELPIEKIYGINPLRVIHSENKYSYWHIGRFAISKDVDISTLTLFKRLMVLAVKPIVDDRFSYMIAEIDSRLLKVMTLLGFKTRQIGKSINYLASETVPVYSSKRGINGFYSRYGNLCNFDHIRQ